MVIRLDKQTDCATICKMIQQMVEKDKRENGNAPRAISIKITDFIYSGDAHIPKLEYKG